jgi:D-alanyl-D-alanine carboxypeptidase/D-alanyl-D-alanine-endopeptidase (penicillin-binding protein 4)
LGEAKPRYRTDSFDCLTYIETVEALARTTVTDSVLPTLDHIRYENGIVGWGTRLHYTEADWLPANTRVGHVRLDTLAGSVIEPRTLGRKAFYAKRGLEREDTTVLLPMLPRDVALKDLARPSKEARVRGIGLVGTITGLGILHTGFLVERPGQLPVLRHASQAGTVREQPLVEYLASKPRFVGIVVWSYLP